MLARLALVGLMCLLPVAGAQARTVYECLRNNRLSLSTAPEPGSKCKPRRVNDRKAKVKNFWGDLGPVRSNLYTTRIDGKAVYSTRAPSRVRRLPSSRGWRACCRRPYRRCAWCRGCLLYTSDAADD